MMTQRALIVDDSRTAQMRLKKLLSRYDLEVDTALSAEQALSYLSYQVPAVVFMDHLMTGMDGFEALKVIKSNPDTATIPVVMYTSQTGDVYLGQARALGAVGVLSKDTMKSANIEEVLKSIGLKAQPPSLEAKAKPAVKSEAVAQPTERPVSQSFRYEPKPLPDSVNAVEAIRKQVAKSLELSIASVRQEIIESRRQLSSRLVKEFKDLKAHLKHGSNAQVERAPQLDVIETAQRSGVGVGVWLVLLVLLGSAGYGAFSTWQLQQQQERLFANFAEFRATIGTEYQQRLQEQRAPKPQVRDREPLLEALGWSFNRSGEVPFGIQALDGEQLNSFSGLLHYLDQAGFHGDIVVELRRGDFCSVVDAEGFVTLPAADSMLAECTLARSVEGDSLPNWLSEGFLDLLANSPILARGEIRVVVEELGFDAPVFNYPAISSDSKVGDWNLAAQANNRVDLLLRSDR